MIDGVTVLATSTVMTTCLALKIILGITLGTIILGAFLTIGGIATGGIRLTLVGSALVGGAFIVMLICLPIDSVTQIPDYNTYEVIIEENVSMKEFTDKYEILEQRGEIYVIKEINSND